MRRHGGARRILSLELLGFKNLLSPASLYSRVNRWLLKRWNLKTILLTLEYTSLGKENRLLNTKELPKYNYISLATPRFYSLRKYLSRKNKNAWPIASLTIIIPILVLLSIHYFVEGENSVSCKIIWNAIREWGKDKFILYMGLNRHEAKGIASYMGL